MRDLHDDMDRHERGMMLDLTGEARRVPAVGMAVAAPNSAVGGKVAVGRSTVHAGGRNGPAGTVTGVDDALQEPPPTYTTNVTAWADAASDVDMIWDAAAAIVRDAGRVGI